MTPTFQPPVTGGAQTPPPVIRVHRNDLPDLAAYPPGRAVAIDTETLGLDRFRDRLCVVQLSPGDGTVDIVQVARPAAAAPNLRQLLEDPARLKILHYARFDMGVLNHAYGVMTSPVFCTKVASKLARTYTDRHSLKDLVREYLDIDLSKQQQSSDWGAETLSEAQLSYAAADVLHLHRLRSALERQLTREGRAELADACFKFLPMRVWLDLAGWSESDIFAHS
jgi:ribonuclease D